MIGRLSIVAVLVVALGQLGCGDSSDDRGACISSGAHLGANECMENWTREACEDFDTRGVNSATWTFYEGQSCSELGW
ncbi:MAG: hypothetical protein JXB32_02930 [Deltaproteobacteria bacterium]|nr:hypothetical protein [Deltaproteobacteria bacterium]